MFEIENLAPPSPRCITFEVTALLELKGRVPAVSPDGDSNSPPYPQIIQAQIDTITHRRTEIEIEAFSWTGEAAAAAHKARRWLAGEETNSPHIEWLTLL